MPNQIERDAYVLRNTLKNPISYVRGTDLLPIIFHFRDFTIPSTADARVFVAKPDGNAVYGNTAINGNDVTVSVQQQMFLVLGTTHMQLEILDGNETLVTFSQPVIVEPNLKAGDFPESITEIKFLDDAIEQAQEAANNASKAVENANNAIETANVAISSANDAAQNANNTAQELLDRAEQGEFDGPQGPSGTITVGTVKTVQPEQNATVKNIGTSNNAVFDFEIPRGSDGMTDLVARYEDTSEYTATPTADAPIVINDLNGKTQQTQTNGYQLFDASKLPSKTQGGATVTNNGDGTFTISGSGNTTENFQTRYELANFKNILKPKKIFISGVDKYIKPYFRIRLIDLEQSNIFTLTSNDNNNGLEITEEMLKNAVTCIIDITLPSGNTIVPGTIKPMLYQDGDGTWEPFSGGVASPSPDWEQKVHGVGDRGYFDGELLQGNISSSGAYDSSNTGVKSANYISCKQGDMINVEYENNIDYIAIAFYNSEYTFISRTISSGGSMNVNSFSVETPTNAKYFKFNIQSYSAVSSSYITPQTAKHISVTINGKYASRVESNGKNICPPVANWEYESLANRYVAKIFLKGGKKYYASSNIPKPEGGKFVFYFMNTTTGVSDTLSKSYTPQKDEYIDMYAYMGRAYSEDALKGIYYIQIEEAEAPTEYEPYRHTSIQFPLTSPLYDGDKICYVKPGESYINSEGETKVADRMLYGVYRENAKVVFDGSEDESWSFVGIERNNRATITIKNSNNNYDNESAKCNLLKYNRTVYEDLSNIIGFIVASNKIFIRFGSDSEINSLEALKTWLQSNNLEVVYKLAQSWFEPFEDQTPFYNLRSFDNITYIYSDDPLNPALTVDVAKNQTGGYIFESLAQAMKNAQKAEAMKSIESRLQALESQAVENI